MPAILSHPGEMVPIAKKGLLKAKNAEKKVELSNLKLDRVIMEELCRINLSLMGYFAQIKRIDFNMKLYTSKKLIDKLPEESYFKVKKYDFVSIKGFTKSKEVNAKRLLQKLHSHTFKVFYFGDEFHPLEAKPFGYYKKEVMKILSKVSLEACFSGCKISQKDFRHIMNCASNCKAIRFKNCLIETGNPDFDNGIKFKTNLVEFDNCQTYSSESRSESLLEVQSIFKAMLGCSLAKSLITIKMSNCGTSKEDFLALAEELNLQGIKLYDDGDDY